MDETPFSAHSGELSPEDLAIIQVFDEINDLMTTGNLDELPQTDASGILSPLSARKDAALDDSDDMLILFTSEAEEDLATMLRALQELEQDAQVASPSLVTLGRAAHKLKGTAGAMGCECMSTIAWHIEEEIQLLKDEKVGVRTALVALFHAVTALDMTLQGLVKDGYENDRPLQKLRQDLNELNAADERVPSADAPPTTEPALEMPVIPFDRSRLHTLIAHSEHLIELYTPLQNIQQEIARSLLELQAAHVRLQRLESGLALLTLPGVSGSEQNRSAGSSLIARILQRGNRQSAARPRSAETSADAPLWDDLELDRFTEQKVLLQSFSEAVADVATAFSQLNVARSQLDALLEQQVRQTLILRNDALNLRSIPFSTFLTQIQQIVQRLERKYQRPIHLDMAGETTEIDQDILDILAEPLLKLIYTSVADSLLSVPFSPLQEPDRILLQAQASGSEVVIDVGFSMPIPGGALEMLRGPIQQIHGSIAPRRNAGGVIYHLRFPRAQGLVLGLLVQAGGQNLVLPLSAIELIDREYQETQGHIYHLATLLGFLPAVPASALPPPILLAGSQRRMAIQVDKILDKIELIMRPLDEHLQRPGIMGTSVDGNGNVLLIVDLPVLVRMMREQQPLAPLIVPAQDEPVDVLQSPRILIADDSVYIRQLLHQIFERAGYTVVEARDGVEALDCISSNQPPAVVLLDIDMPNLNGYDMLNILHAQTDFIDCKIIMLTSRFSEKHRRRALELGAYTFLSKPCSEEVLLDVVQRALANLPPPA